MLLWPLTTRKVVKTHRVDDIEELTLDKGPRLIVNDAPPYLGSALLGSYIQISRKEVIFKEKRIFDVIEVNSSARDFHLVCELVGKESE